VAISRFDISAGNESPPQHMEVDQSQLAQSARSASMS
jgi:hypothetical protein